MDTYPEGRAGPRCLTKEGWLVLDAVNMAIYTTKIAAPSPG
jgi:hypothetical protein